MKFARNLFDATVLALQLQSCDDVMQSIAALKSNRLRLMQHDAVHYITKFEPILICNVFCPNGISVQKKDMDPVPVLVLQKQLLQFRFQLSVPEKFQRFQFLVLVWFLALPTHYLPTLTAHGKLNIVLRNLHCMS